MYATLIRRKADRQEGGEKVMGLNQVPRRIKKSLRLSDLPLRRDALRCDALRRDALRRGDLLDERR